VSPNWQERSSCSKVVGLDYFYVSECFVGTSRNCLAYGGIFRYRGRSRPSVAPAIPTSPARPIVAFHESVVQDIHTCLWARMRGRRRLHRSPHCAATADITRGCDGDRSSGSYDRRDAVTGSEPRFTLAMVHNSHSEHTRSPGRRSSP
jgi:hypothetical protein